MNEAIDSFNIAKPIIWMVQRIVESAILHAPLLFDEDEMFCGLPRDYELKQKQKIAEVFVIINLIEKNWTNKINQVISVQENLC